MSEDEHIIASLDEKGYLDDASIARVRTHLKRRLKEEVNDQEKEIIALRAELALLQSCLPA